MKATPAARRLAEEGGVDLAQVEGSGKDGTVTVRDVRAYRPAEGDVVAAVRRDLAAFGDLADSALGASALALARELDEPGNSATSKSNCAKALIETLDRLRELAPPPEEARDQLDDLSARRAARRAQA